MRLLRLLAAQLFVLAVGIGFAPNDAGAAGFDDIRLRQRLELAIATMESEDADLVRTYIGDLVLGRHPSADVVKRVTYISPLILYAGTHWTAGTLLHEAVHHRDWAICLPIGGVESEARALERETHHHERVDDGLAPLARALVGTHGSGAVPVMNPECEIRSLFGVPNGT